MYIDYRWVAMLDPVELADGDMQWQGDRGPRPVEIRRLCEVQHEGRRAWEAIVRTTEAYVPRCSCCPLLFGIHSEQREAATGGPTLRDSQPDIRYAEEHRVRLDVMTGVCVLTEEIGGSHASTGYTVRIEAVDETIPDNLFRSSPRTRSWWRWR